MPFVRMPGVIGLVYVPDEQDASCKKHNCPDCTSCQWCSDSRCDICLKRKQGTCCKQRKARGKTPGDR